MHLQKNDLRSWSVGPLLVSTSLTEFLGSVKKTKLLLQLFLELKGVTENRVQNLIFRICSINNVSDYEKTARAHFEFFRSKLKLEQINFLFVHQYTKFQIYFSFQCTKPCLTFQSIIVLSKSFETCLFFYCHPRALSNSFQAETVP